ncbi:MAG: cytochrome c oxidase subunit 3 [Myxococcales bacterium]|nr:cytochrome c oxidase subunit 3 [Myxococcales bacterium]
MSEAHFESAERQADAARLGMWAFLVSEVFLFAGLFTLYGAYRAAWPEAFAEGVRHGAKMLGSLNTVILITSSFAVASSLRALQEDRPRVALRWLLGTLALALGFLAVKAVEYHGHVHEGILPGGHGHHFATLSAPAGQAAFFTLYYVMTGLHALHVVAGAAVLGWLAWRLHTGVLDARRAHVLSNGALYWHLVDCVWIVLWPLFYLTGGQA